MYIKLLLYKRNTRIRGYIYNCRSGSYSNYSISRKAPGYWHLLQWFQLAKFSRLYFEGGPQWFTVVQNVRFCSTVHSGLIQRWKNRLDSSSSVLWLSYLLDQAKIVDLKSLFLCSASKLLVAPLDSVIEVRSAEVRHMGRTVLQVTSHLIPWVVESSRI